MKVARNFLFLGSRITADSDCSHEIRRQLLLGRKAMTNLDSELKSRDITLPTVDGFELWCWSRPLKAAARRSHQSILREINPEYSLEGLMLKRQYFGHLI